MNIGIVASEGKRLQLENFCTAYNNILKKNNIFTIDEMGDNIKKIIDKPITSYLSCDLGGINQFISKIRDGGLDAVILLKDYTSNEEHYKDLLQIEKECDEYIIPLATNMAMAEVLIMAINNGEFYWS